MPAINALLLVKNVVKPVGWAISYHKDPNYDPVCHFEFWGRPIKDNFKSQEINVTVKSI